MMRPLEDRVVLRRLEPETKSPGGIVIPDSAQEKSQRGSVLAIGPGKMLDSGERAKMSVKVGDVVVFAKYGGNEVKVGNEVVIIVRESDVFAIDK
jgi:chaperonin GroES